MKKAKFLILFSIISLFIFSVPAYADDEITISYNNSEIHCPVPPYIENGCTMVPAEVFEELGATFFFSDHSSTATEIIFEWGDSFAYMSYGKPYIAVSRKNKRSTAVTQVATEAVSINRRINDLKYVFVPLRSMAEVMGFNVEWDNDSRTVTLTKAEPFKLAVEYSPAVRDMTPANIMVSVINGDPDSTYSFDWSCDEGHFEAVYINDDTCWVNPDESALYTETALWKWELGSYIDDPHKVRVTVTDNHGISVTEEIDVTVTIPLAGSVM